MMLGFLPCALRPDGAVAAWACGNPPRRAAAAAEPVHLRKSRRFIVCVLIAGACLWFDVCPPRRVENGHFHLYSSGYQLKWDFPYQTLGYTTKPFDSTIISTPALNYNNAKVFFTNVIASSAEIRMNLRNPARGPKGFVAPQSSTQIRATGEICGCLLCRGVFFPGCVLQRAGYVIFWPACSIVGLEVIASPQGDAAICDPAAFEIASSSPGASSQ